MIKAEKIFKMGDLVHCIELSKDNVEGLELGKKYRVVAESEMADGTKLYGIVDAENVLKFAPSWLIGYVTEKVNKPIQAKEDVVNHPSHYTAGGIETIEFLKAKMSAEELHGYLRGNVLKYLSRAGKKDDVVQDLEKAEWYLKRLITELKSESTAVAEPEPAEFGDNPMTKKQQMFIAGLCEQHGIDRTNIPSYLSEVSDYHNFTEVQATHFIDKLLEL